MRALIERGLKKWPMRSVLFVALARLWRRALSSLLH